MQLLAELKRRNVIRMAGLYLVAAWLIVQVSATLLPVFEAPGWVMKALVTLLAIGFPAAVAVSWVFELTPAGLKRDADVPPTESIAPQTARRMDRMLLLVMALALGYFAFDKFVLAPERATSSATAAQDEPTEAAARAHVDTNEASIAVLPFVNMSTDVENGFFADGISEELLNVLAGVEGLKVASRTSSFSFKGKDTAIPEIARQLGVRHVLEGSVRKQGQRVRITAQLIHAGTDGHLWSETYDRDLTDIFKVQEEIARAITGELEGILGKRDVAVVASTQNLQAYQDFLRGRARFHRRNELLEAIGDLSKAVEQDPEFGEAWVYLSALWWVAPGYLREEQILGAKAMAESKAALERAKALAPDHPMVPAVQAVLNESAGDYIGALALLQESAKRSVQDSTPAMWLGLFLLRTGHIEESTAALETAREMDPLAGINNGYLALAYLSSGRNAEAEAAARMAAVQGWTPAIQILCFDLAARGENERAVALWEELVEPRLAKVEAARSTARRRLLLDKNDSAALLSLWETSSTEARLSDMELGASVLQPDLVLDVAEEIQKQPPERQRRQYWLRSAWLPSTRALREDPRFFAVADGMGIVDFWEARGYPAGCQRVEAADGDRLQCARP